MDTPEKISPMLFERRLRTHIAAHYNTAGRQGWQCKKCGGTIIRLTAALSLHDARFSNLCAGAGEVRLIPIPYCPKCDPVPKASGCLHE
jgi:hypothetical protein